MREERLLTEMDFLILHKWAGLKTERGVPRFFVAWHNFNGYGQVDNSFITGKVQAIWLLGKIRIRGIGSIRIRFSLTTRRGKLQGGKLICGETLTKTA